MKHLGILLYCYIALVQSSFAQTAPQLDQSVVTDSDKPKQSACPALPPGNDLNETIIVSEKQLRKKIVNLIAFNFTGKGTYKMTDREIVVNVFLDKQGNLFNVVVTKGYLVVRPYARETAKRSTFKPTPIAGEAVNVCSNLSFKLNKPSKKIE